SAFAALALLPAALADCCAWFAAVPAACAFWSTWPMAASFWRVRSCVASTEPWRSFTLVLTSPTRFLTNPLLAHAERPVATRPESRTVDFHLDILTLLPSGYVQLPCQSKKPDNVAEY